MVNIAGFGPELLDEGGGLRWANELVNDNGFTLHAFQGLNPEQALALVGGKLISALEPGELPTESPDEWTTPVHVAVNRTSDSELLVAGAGGPDWSFVLDLSGQTAFDMSELTHNPQGFFRGRAAADLPPGPRTVAMFTCTINGDENLVFSEGDEEYRFDGWDDIHTHEADYGQALPATLIPAIEAAGTFGEEDEDLGDNQVGLRVLGVLAGLLWTPEEFRSRPLLVGYF